MAPGGLGCSDGGSPLKPAGEMPALRSGPQPCEDRNPHSERVPQPGFRAYAPSPAKRHTLTQAGPAHPKPGKLLRECGGCISGTTLILKYMQGNKHIAFSQETL